MTSSGAIKLSEDGHIELLANLACIMSFGKCFSFNASSLQMSTEATSEDTQDQVKDVIAAIWKSREAAEVALTYMPITPEAWFKLMAKRYSVSCNCRMTGLFHAASC